MHADLVNFSVPQPSALRSPSSAVVASGVRSAGIGTGVSSLSSTSSADSPSTASSAWQTARQQDVHIQPVPTLADVSATLSGSKMARSNREKVPWVGQPTGHVARGPATATAAEAAVIAAELCRDIRQIRHGTALVAECDAVLATRMDMLHKTRTKCRLSQAVDLGPSRFQPDVRWFARTAEFRIFNREELVRMMFIAAIIFQSWFLLAHHPAMVFAVLVRSADRCFLVRFLHGWCCHVKMEQVARCLKQLEAQCRDVHHEGETHLAQLQARYLQIRQSDIAKRLRAVLGSRFSSLTSAVFASWSWRTKEDKEKQTLISEMLRNHSASQLMASCMQLSMIWGKWAEWVRRIKSMKENQGSMSKFIMMLAGTYNDDFVRAALQAWAFEAARSSRIQRVRRASKEHSQGVQAQLLEARLRYQEDTRRRQKQAVNAIISQTTEGLLVGCIRGWRHAAYLSTLQADCRRLQERHKAAVARSMRKRHPDPSCGPLNLAMSLVNNVTLRLQLAEWRLAAGLSQERLQMLEALTAQERIKSELQANTKKLNEQTRRKAIELISSWVAVQTAALKHGALERWQLGVCRAETTAAKENERKNKELIANLRLEVGAMTISLQRQRMLSILGLGSVADVHIPYSCAVLFRIWEAEMRQTQREAECSRRREALDAMEREVRALQVDWTSKRRDVAQRLIALTNFNIYLNKVIQSWKNEVLVRKADEELQNLAEEAQVVQADINQMALAKRKAMLAPLSSWIAAHLGAMTVSRKMVVHSWSTVVAKEKASRHRNLQRKAVQQDAVDLCCACAEHADRALMRIVFFAFKQTQALQCSERLQAELRSAQSSKCIMQRRMISFMRIHVTLEGALENCTWTWKVFREWRYMASSASVGRTCDRICETLDDQILRGRDSLRGQKRRYYSALGLAAERQTNSELVPRFVAELCFPAWQRLTSMAARRRTALGSQEGGMQQIQALSARAVEQRQRWAAFVSSQQPVAHRCQTMSDVLNSWMLIARLRRQQRADLIAGRAALGCADVGLALGSTALLRRRVFAGWLACSREAAVQRLETQARVLEDRVKQMGLEVDLDMLSDLSQSSSSEDEAVAGDFEQSEVSVDPFADRMSGGMRGVEIESPVQNDREQSWLRRRRDWVDSPPSFLSDSPVEASACPMNERSRMFAPTQPPSLGNLQSVGAFSGHHIAPQAHKVPETPQATKAAKQQSAQTVVPSQRSKLLPFARTHGMQEKDVDTSPSKFAEKLSRFRFLLPEPM